MEIELNDNTDKSRFEVEIQDKMAIMDYKKKDNKLYILHTEVPKEFEGKGIASAMVKKVLHLIKEKDMKLVSLCPFVSGYIKRHPEYKSLVANA
ncbi:N-acetyltransferase [Marixanthomonas sp. SCSIO 43207]|uniref:GNAT family N-acetyltransferase n=1 Tax=Marixanthomonas sp. SCSIO 43207 TaxID=2779360 RepID=UPI001CA91D77|nr:GNAT family N-acetyltransferase [Marixanthomonas sp. SCSIO 43207]UAB81399.1 N-acetyltransferase [Marixanthomonas sp. SCSIO 43207]